MAVVGEIFLEGWQLQWEGEELLLGYFGVERGRLHWGGWEKKGERRVHLFRKNRAGKRRRYFWEDDLARDWEELREKTRERESFWMLVWDWVFERESIRLAWEGGQLKKKDGLLISGQPSWRGFSGMFIVDSSFASTGKFFFSCFCWFLDDFCWLGVSMLISLSLMIFVEDLFGSVPVSPWDICNLVLIFIWYSFDFTHPHMSSLINIWNEACINSCCSYCMHSVLVVYPVSGTIPGLCYFPPFHLWKQGVTERIISSRRVLGGYPGTKMTCSSG